MKISPTRILMRISLAMGLLLCLLSLQSLSAQQDTLSTGIDDLFLLARNKAVSGEREEARKLCRIILQRSPAYLDARILLARTYAWDNRRNEARRELRAVLEQQSGNTDALLALTDVEIWDGNITTALELLISGIASSPHNDALLVKKARALRALNREEEALLTLNLAEDLNPSNPEIKEVRRLIQKISMSNSVTISYSADHYSQYYGPMNYGSVQWSRRTSLGPMIARINYANRFASQGWQVEMDTYPRIAEGYYAYLNYGYSGSPLFPKHRFGAECYMRLPLSMEASLGLRHLYFDSRSSIDMYTGTIGIYAGNYWFSLRPAFTPNAGSYSTSMAMTVRYYLGSAEDYLSMKGGFGFSPDERTIQSSSGLTGTQLFYLKSQTFGLGWQGGITELLSASLIGDYTNQELSFRAGSYVALYSFTMGLRIKF